jgi:hypothetical protein
MGKNVTIYLPDEVAQKMDQLPEVNWSEICRKAISDYIDTRTKTDLTSVIARLKNERKTDYTKGQILVYEVLAPQISNDHLESMEREINLSEIIARISISDPISGHLSKLTEEEAKAIAKVNMRANLHSLKGIIGENASPSYPSDSYIEGVISAIQDLIKRVRSTPI